MHAPQPKRRQQPPTGALHAVVDGDCSDADPRGARSVTASSPRRGRPVSERRAPSQGGSESGSCVRRTRALGGAQKPGRISFHQGVARVAPHGSRTAAASACRWPLCGRRGPRREWRGSTVGSQRPPDCQKADTPHGSRGQQQQGEEKKGEKTALRDALPAGATVAGRAGALRVTGRDRGGRHWRCGGCPASSRRDGSGQFGGRAVRLPRLRRLVEGGRRVLSGRSILQRANRWALGPT